MTTRSEHSAAVARQTSTADLAERMRRKAEWERVQGGKGHLDDATADRLEQLQAIADGRIPGQMTIEDALPRKEGN